MKISGVLLASFLLSAKVQGFVAGPGTLRFTSLLVSTKSDIEGGAVQNSTSPAPRKPSASAPKYKKIEVEEYQEYSRCLSPREEKKEVQSEFVKKPRWKRAIRKLFSRKTKRGALILLRCGQSEFNLNQTFTGWLDPPLTEQGIQQCQVAGRLLVQEGFDPDLVYTSRLQRSIVSAWTILETMDSLFIQVQKTYRLNQRMYGALQGLSKQGITNEFGPEVVKAWRHSLKARPPPLSREDPTHPRNDRRYANLPDDRISDTESLLECQERARQLWDHQIRRDIENGKTVLVVGHQDSLRGLSKVIDGISDKDICDIHIPCGIPIVYRFNEDMEPIEPDDTSLTQVHTRSIFLENPGRLQEALKKNAEWNKASEADGTVRKRTNSLEKSLMKLRSVDDQDDVQLRSDKKPVERMERWSDDPCEFEQYDDFADFDYGYKDVAVNLVPLDESSTDAKPNQEGPFVVLIRHGRTPHNNMKLFTGWEDPPLAEEGVEDAKNAGRLLKLHNIEFDIVYTSWLTRAIQTAFYALEEMNCVWLPIVKSWRLNERMYGDLTGKSKKMIAVEYGEDQLKKWRRGYTIRPPPTSSYSLSYPGNDERRAKHFKDIPISLSETINRSIEKRKLSVHRKFPKSESLKDCMDRSIPFYTQRIQHDAVEKGKRVLITSHENAIRGILMHLCDIPEEAMNQLHLPNGLPLVYNVKGRCITLLDDGSGTDPMDAHDFGPAAKYLFKPCELDDSFFEEMESRATS
jgi:2,3-bisphosphoglycerate-dependent phosphoglycerate mutase